MATLLLPIFAHSEHIGRLKIPADAGTVGIILNPSKSNIVDPGHRRQREADQFWQPPLAQPCAAAMAGFSNIR
jgi:hypothetical protein